MVVLAPWSSLILPSGRTKPLVRGEENPAAWLPHRGVYQESGLLAIALAMCRLRPPHHCVLAVSCFFFGTYFGDRREIVLESSWRLDLA